MNAKQRRKARRVAGVARNLSGCFEQALLDCIKKNERIVPGIMFKPRTAVPGRWLQAHVEGDMLVIEEVYEIPGRIHAVVVESKIEV